jgi:hypothetical protein
VDSIARFAGGIARTSDHAGPAPARFEVAYIVIEQQVGTGRNAQTSRLQYRSSQ